MRSPTMRRAALVAFALSFLITSTQAAGPPDPQALSAAQRDAMKPLAAFQGTWRGPAEIRKPDGSSITITQTERVGPMLDDTLLVIEGRGFAPDGSSTFNAFGVVSFDVASGSYTFRAYAQGHDSNFPMEVTPGGFAWSIPAGPATIRYVATVRDDTWTETGDFQMPGQAPRRIFEMTVKRVGTTDWPSAGGLKAAP